MQENEIKQQYIIMNHEEVIKYIKNNFQNMLDDKIKSFENSVRNNL